jgi:hypothetical protein
VKGVYMNAKRFSALFLAVTFAFVSTPSAQAVAMTAPGFDTWLAISPCNWDCLEAEILDPETGDSLDTMLATVPATFLAQATAAEIDPETSTVYFISATEIYSYDLTSDSDVQLLTSTDDFPADSVSLRGLAFDEATDILYVLWYDDNATQYFLTGVDVSTGDVDQTGLELDDYLLGDDGSDAAIAGDTLYVLVSDELVSLDLADGSLISTEAFPDVNFFDTAVDSDSNGNLRVVLKDTQENQNHFSTYNIANDEWSDPVTTARQDDAFAWWESPSDDAVEQLADTGVDSGGIALASASLLVVGGAIALRRRARR